jgi:hypothetical protein
MNFVFMIRVPTVILIRNQVFRKNENTLCFTGYIPFDTGF